VCGGRRERPRTTEQVRDAEEPEREGETEGSQRPKEEDREGMSTTWFLGKSNSRGEGSICRTCEEIQSCQCE
jgi:hypothetical protein